MSTGLSPQPHTWLIGATAAGNRVLLSRPAAHCLRYIAEHPGASSVEVQDAVGILYPSQASQLLLRLERSNLIHTERGKRALNAWELTQAGAEALRELPEGIYE